MKITTIVATAFVFFSIVLHTTHLHAADDRQPLIDVIEVALDGAGVYGTLQHATQRTGVDDIGDPSEFLFAAASPVGSPTNPTSGQIQGIQPFTRSTSIRPMGHRDPGFCAIVLGMLCCLIVTGGTMIAVLFTSKNE